MNYVNDFLDSFMDMFVDMSFYLMIGLIVVGFLNAYVKKEKILKHLGTNKFSSIVKASLVGVPLPLCSCGVVPTALELKRGGASNGAVISFLISTPQTGVDSIAATYSMMGIVMAVYRPIAAFFSGIFGGALVNLFAKNEKINVDVEIDTCCSDKSSSIDSCCCHKAEPIASCCSTVEHFHSGCCESDLHHDHDHENKHHQESDHNHVTSTETNKIKSALKYAFCDFLDEISTHFVIGLFLASLISAFIPSDFFVNMGMDKGILAMFGMVLIGVPMYICSTSSIPIALSLVEKGLSIGSGFVFLFTGPVTNIASIMMLASVLGKKLTSIYIGIVIGFSVLFGLLLDVIVEQFQLDLLIGMGSAHHGSLMHSVYQGTAVIFLFLLIGSFYRKFKTKNNGGCCH